MSIHINNQTIKNGYVAGQQISRGYVNNQLFYSATQDVSAPSLSINDIESITERGGDYDSASYAWSIESGGGSITGTGSVITYTAPSVTQNTMAVIRCTATLTKAGRTPINVTNTTSFVITTVPATIAPRILPPSTSSVNEGSRTLFSRRLSGGLYRNTVTTWNIVSGGGHFIEGGGMTSSASGSSASYVAPQVDQDTTVTIRIRLVATGDGVISDGRVSASPVTFSFTVKDTD